MDRLGFYLACGQSLSNTMIEAKEALEDLALEDAKINPERHTNLDSRVRERLKTVRLQLGSSEDVLCPNKYFSLNNKTTLTLMGAVTGYFVILLQFKQARF